MLSEIYKYRINILMRYISINIKPKQLSKIILLTLKEDQQYGEVCDLLILLVYGNL